MSSHNFKIQLAKVRTIQFMNCRLQVGVAQIHAQLAAAELEINAFFLEGANATLKGACVFETDG